MRKALAAGRSPGGGADKDATAAHLRACWRRGGMLTRGWPAVALARGTKQVGPGFQGARARACAGGEVGAHAVPGLRTELLWPGGTERRD